MLKKFREKTEKAIIEKQGGVKHKNFYENIGEAQMRLRGTIVVYDHDDSQGIEPYYVHAISNHMKDGVFRIYLEPLHRQKEMIGARSRYPGVDQVPADSPQVGIIMDKWMEVPSQTDYFVRKKMDSKYFNNFRPFPLGMCNMGGEDGRCYYIERQPQRNREQGLTRAMVVENLVSLGTMPVIRGSDPYGGRVNFMTAAFRSCIRGEYPTLDEVLRELKNPKNGNEAVGFHRHFAIIKGPMDLLFLGYKDKTVGILPNADLSEIRIGRTFAYTREAIEELGVFDRIIQK